MKTPYPYLADDEKLYFRRPISGGRVLPIKSNIVNRVMKGLRMATKNPSQVAQKWANNLGSSTAAIEQGVNSVTTAPTQLAKAKQAKMKANLLAAIDSGKWARGLDRVSLSDWKTAMISKGLPRVGQGAQAAVGDFATFMGEMLPYQEQLQGTVNALPDVTLDDNINRMVAWARGMSKFTRTK